MPIFKHLDKLSLRNTTPYSKLQCSAAYVFHVSIDGMPKTSVLRVHEMWALSCGTFTRSIQLLMYVRDINPSGTATQPAHESSQGIMILL
jgi:hypothetical protein